MSKTYEEIRLRAKEYGVRNWHTKKLDRLKTEVDKIEEGMGSRSGGSPDGTVSKVSFGQLMDVLDEYAMSTLTDAFDALDVISRPSSKNMIEALDTIFHSHPVLSHTVSMDWLYQRTCVVSKRRISNVAFSNAMEAVCKVYAGRGWYIDLNDNVLVKPNKPVFRLDWHVRLWQKSDSSRKEVYRMLAILSQPEQEVEDYEQEEAV
jgi:hypothetical protein